MKAAVFKKLRSPLEVETLPDPVPGTTKSWSKYAAAASAARTCTSPRMPSSACRRVSCWATNTRDASPTSARCRSRPHRRARRRIPGAWLRPVRHLPRGQPDLVQQVPLRWRRLRPVFARRAAPARAVAADAVACGWCAGRADGGEPARREAGAAAARRARAHRGRRSHRPRSRLLVASPGRRAASR